MAIDLFDLSGRAAFVTGGASGIGLAIVEAAPASAYVTGTVIPIDGGFAAT
jgi:NAD(P)-dependent dehydrogenase (short-subunit alcohol dehydrogenase family)